MKYFLLFLLLIINGISYAQKSDSLAKEKGYVVLPAIFYSPETSLGFGAAGLVYFRFGERKDGKYRPSNLQSVFIYTLEKQILFSNPYNLFLNQEKDWIKGEIGYYVYPYEYYGIGTDVSINANDAELYEADFFRLEVNYLRRLKEHFYMGPTLFYDQYSRIDADPNGKLVQDKLLGLNPGRLLGYGVSFILDKRNNIFSPSHGYYLEGRFLRYENTVLGEFPFSDMYLDARKYFNPGNKWEAGVQFYHQSIIGSPPFYNYALLGGSKLMRGYYKGAYRDNHQTILQTEVRHYLFNRIVFAAFGGIGSVSGNIVGYDKLLGSYGVGLRYELNKAEHIRIRLDYARGNNTDGFYININEAF